MRPAPHAHLASALMVVIACVALVAADQPMFNHHPLTLDEEESIELINTVAQHASRGHAASPQSATAPEHHDAAHFIVELREVPAPPIDAVRKQLGHDDVHIATDGAQHVIVHDSLANIGAKLAAAIPVAAVHRLAPEHKTHAALKAKLDPDMSAKCSTSDTTMFVKFARSVGHDAAEKAIQGAIDATLQRDRTCEAVAIKRTGQSLRLKAAPTVCACQATLRAVAGLPSVRWMELRHRFNSQNNVATKTIQSATTDSRPIWANGITGEGQLVAVGDTGLDFDSCFFRDEKQSVTFYPQTNANHRKILSYVECEEDGDRDHKDKLSGHGTHVTGSFVGKSLGTHADHNGLAKDAKVVFHDLTCGSDPDGLYLPGDLYDYFVPQYTLGARVSSNSWGNLAPTEYTAVDRETDLFCYEHQDFLAVYAAGNNPNAGVLSPSASKNVLTVGAHKNSLNAAEREQIAQFSAHGPTFDGRIKPEVTTPGQPVVSAESDGILNSNQCQLSSKQGTSMATPFVSGAATLLREYLQKGYLNTGKPDASKSFTPSGSLLKAMIIHTTKAMTAIPNANIRPNGIEGFGRVELSPMMYFAGGAAPVVQLHLINNVTLAQDGHHSDCVEVGTTHDFKATMTWFDPASAAEGAHMSVVNNLDLVVSDAKGGLHYPLPFRSSPNKPIKGQVVEQVVIPAASLKALAGSDGKVKLRIHVFATEVKDAGLFGGQPFSAVAWGADLTNPTDDQCAAGGFDCPKSCSGHGTCEKGMCKCEPAFSGVDCSVCNPRVVCSGNGVCDANKKCTCAVHIAPASTDCSTCASGWFGPHCNGDCACGSHGRCDFTTTGQCQCYQDADKGYWQGAHCRQCAFDYTNTATGCKQPSSWCINKATRTIKSATGGMLQINDQFHYENSVSCRWHIIAPDPKWQVQINFHKFDIEEPYDWVKVVDGATESGNKIAKITGKMGAGKTYTSTGPDMFIYFQADFLGTGNGFTAEYSMVRVCDASTCNGHGRCMADNSCGCDGHFDPNTLCATCEKGWFGDDCTQTYEPNQTTSSSSPPVSSPGSSSAAVPETPAPAPTGSGAPQTASPNAAGCGPESKCSHQGQCVGGKCNCDSGFTGDFCNAKCPDIRIDNSLPAPCNNRGTCHPQRCQCDDPDTYVGAACQIPVRAVVDLTPTRSAFRFVSSATTMWQFFHVKVPAFPAAHGSPVVTVNVMSLREPHTQHQQCNAPPVRGTFRVVVWDTIEHAGDLSQAIGTTVTDSNGLACLSVVGWHSGTTVLGVVDGEASNNNTAVVSVAFPSYNFDAACPLNRVCRVDACPVNSRTATCVETPQPIAGQHTGNGGSNDHSAATKVRAAASHYGVLLVVTIASIILGVATRAGFVEIRRRRGGGSKRAYDTINVTNDVPATEEMGDADDLDDADNLEEDHRI